MSRLRRAAERASTGWIALGAALLLTAVAAWQARELTVVTRLEELLPEGSRAAADYRRFLTTFGGFEKVYAMIVWRGPEPEAALLADAADRLARRLVTLPEVAAVRSGIDAGDEEFLYRWLLPRAPLFLGDDDEVRPRLAPAAVRGRMAQFRRSLTSPLGRAQARWRAADPLGFAGEPGQLVDFGMAGQIDPMTGALLAPRGDAVLLLVTPTASELDPAAGRALAAGLAAAAEELAAALPAAPLEVMALGGPLYAAQDEVLIRADLIRTVTSSALAVVLLLLLYFGSVGVPAALVAAVGAGVVWAAGLVAVTHGEVSVLGLSFAAMLLGLGVDYGIHGASRFRAARLAAIAPGPAVLTAIRQTGPAIIASALTTSAAFLVLSLAHFRPVKEMGQVMAGGILAILAASVLLGGPLLALTDRSTRRPPRRDGPRTLPWRALGRLTDALVTLGDRHSTAVVLAAVALTAAAGWGATRLEVSHDLRALRPQNHPAFAVEEFLVDHFAVGLDSFTVVVEGETLTAALVDAQRVVEALADRLPPGSTVAAPTRWLPDDEAQQKRLRILVGEPARNAASVLRQALAEEGMRPQPFAAALAVLDAAGHGEAPPAIPATAWPDWLRELVHRRPDGGVALAVRVDTPLGAWPGGPPAAIIELLAAAAPAAAVASVPRIGAELRRVVLADFSHLGAWALATVAAVVLITFRGRPRPALLALLPVTLGGLWTLGLAGAIGVALDPFTVVVAPLLLGIGIDDGLHALVGVRVHGTLTASLLENGRAMALTTLTTSAGFGGLLASRVPSLRSGGLLVASGAIFCLLVTLLLLPAVQRLSGGAGSRR